MLLSRLGSSSTDVWLLGCSVCPQAIRFLPLVSLAVVQSWRDSCTRYASEIGTVCIVFTSNSSAMISSDSSVMNVLDRVSAITNSLPGRY